MTHLLTLKGQVLYANGKPVPNAEVRVFDRDRPKAGNPDDDLSTQPAVTDAQGNFQVPFDTRLNAEFADPLTPYVAIQYQVKGIGRWFTQDFSFIPLFQQTIEIGAILLPEYEPVQFIPSQHGFHFVNSFRGVPLPFDIPLQRFESQTHGLCGGMAYLAADATIFSRAIPDTDHIPRKGTARYNLLYGRLLDSFGPAFRNVFRLQNWTKLPLDTVNGLQKLSREAFLDFQVQLDMGQLVPLFVMLDREALWNSHQILAYRYAQQAEDSLDIGVYDPNFPNQDNVVIRCKTVNLNPAGQRQIQGFTCQIINTQRPNVPLYPHAFGLFSSGYTPKLPPVQL